MGEGGLDGSSLLGKEILAQVIKDFGEGVTLDGSLQGLDYPAGRALASDEAEDIRGRLQRREAERNYG